MTRKYTEEELGVLTDEAQSDFCPFGYLDIKEAVRAALEVGEFSSWVYEVTEEFADSCGQKISDCDPVYCVYDAILQHARNQFIELIEYDFCNDCESGEIYTAGNFCCTQYDYKEEAREELQKRLKKGKIFHDDLDQKTNWFLSEINIDLNKKKKVA